MPQPIFSDEQIFAALETVIDYLAEKIPNEKFKSFAPKRLEADLLAAFQQESGYSKKTAYTIFKCCYWHLQDEGILNVDTLHEIRYSLNRPITEELKLECCFQIFAKQEKYILANCENCTADKVEKNIELD